MPSRTGRATRQTRRSSSPVPHDRARRVDAELRQRARQLERDYLTFVELLDEFEREGWYARFRCPDLATYVERELRLSYRSIRRRLKVVETVRALPSGEQDDARTKLAALGAHKASIVSPAIQQDTAGWRNWITVAEAETVETLQARVSRILGHRPRGHAEDPGERWYRALLAGLSDNLQTDTRRAFKLAELPLEKADPNPKECWAAIVHEFVATWEPRAVS